MKNATLTIEVDCPESTTKALVDMLNILAESSNSEIDRIILLLKKEVLKNIGGSLVNREDYWQEYCEENKLNY